MVLTNQLSDLYTNQKDLHNEMLNIWTIHYSSCICFCLVASTCVYPALLIIYVYFRLICWTTVIVCPLIYYSYLSQTYSQENILYQFLRVRSDRFSFFNKIHEKSESTVFFGCRQTWTSHRRLAFERLACLLTLSLRYTI